MRTIFGSRRAQSLMRFCVFLIAAALIAGMAGCDYTPPPSENLEIRDWYDLDAVRDNLRGNHTLMNDLDSTTAGYEELASPTANGGKGWQPIGFIIGEGGPIFKGTFDGQGYEIRDLYINRPNEDFVGLFGPMDGVIRDVGAVNVTVVGKQSVGGLAGWVLTVSDSYSIGSVTGNKYVGGLAGSGSSVSNSYSTGDVTGIEDVGGLLGYTAGTVSNSYSTGDVTGIENVGGLLGDNSGGTMSDSYSTGSVTGEEVVGGLVGRNTGSVNDSYSSGDVTGTWGVGGLVGSNGYLTYDGTVSKCYSTGNITGDEYVGGLVGKNEGSAPMDGVNFHGTVSYSFWDTQTSGQATSDGGTGKTTAEMQDITTFSGVAWDIIAVALNETNPAYIWNIVNNVTYPFLSWQPV
jgi:hypothetical protein